MNDRSWHTHSTKTALKTPWFTITEHAMTTADGHDATYFIHSGHDAMLVVCVTDDNKVLIESQYRPPVERVTLDYPCGGIEPTDTDPEAAARRELKEETGHEALELIKLGVLDKDPGFSTNKIHIFLARAGSISVPRPDATESIQLQAISAKEVMILIESGELNCQSCVAATLLAFRKLGWLQPSS